MVWPIPDRRESVEGLDDGLGQVEGFERHGVVAPFEPGEVEEVLDQRVEGAGVRRDAFGEDLALRFAEGVPAFGQHEREPRDRRHRRAQLVRGRAEERRLELVEHLEAS